MKAGRKSVEEILKKAADGFVPDTELDIAGREIKDFDFLTDASAVKDSSYTKQATPRKKTSLKFVSAIAAVIMFAAIGFGAYFGFANSENNTVYLDINPSIYIVTDKQDRVKRVGAYNQDASYVLDGLDLKGKKFDVALELILDSTFEKGYLTATENNDIIIGVEGKDKKKNRAKEEKIKNLLITLNSRKAYGFNFDVREVKNENKKDAKEYGISPSKYALIKEITELDNSYSVEALKDKSVKELKALLALILEK